MVFLYAVSWGDLCDQVKNGRRSSTIGCGDQRKGEDLTYLG